MSLRGRVEQIDLGAQIDFDGSPWVLPGKRGKGLTGEVVDPVGLGLGEQRLGKSKISQVSFDKGYATFEVEQVLKTSKHAAEYLHVLLGEQEIGQVAARKAIETGN
jgi:hypothetical protein